MKAKLVTFVAGVMVLSAILHTGYQPAVAAPAKELKIAVATMGVEKPIPRMGHGGNNKDYQKLLYDPLVGTNPDGSLSTETGLANKWEMTPDGLTWTFYLRKGVKFHDGVEVTAKDVRFSLEILARPDSTADYAREVRYSVKSMEVKDPYTLIIHCKEPNLFLPSLLSDVGGQEGLIVPKDAYERMGEAEFMKHPIGSGPYKFQSQMVGSHIKLEAVDKHWRDGVPRFKYVTFRIIPEESSRIAHLRTGEVNIADINRESVERIKKAGFNVVAKEAAAVVMSCVNMQYVPGPNSDIRYRKALALAINYDEVIKHVFAGLAKPTTGWPGRLALQCGGDPSFKPLRYDPEEARRLIKEGGYEGHEFGLPSYTRSGCPELPYLVEALAGYWEKIGLKPKIFMTDFGSWKQRMRTRKTQNHVQTLDVATSSICPVILRFYRAYMHGKTGQTMIQISEVDKLIDGGFASQDMAEVQKNVGTLQRYFQENYNWIPICEIATQIATAKDISAWNTGSRRYDNNYNDLIRQR